MEMAAQWLRRKLTGGVHQRVTRFGLVYTAATLLVGISAFLSANNLLFLILAVMLSALLVSGFVSRLGLGGLHVDLEMPGHLAARIPATGHLRIRNTKSWMPSFSIQLEGGPDSGFSQPVFFPVLPGGAAVEEPVTLVFPRRGQYREDSFLLSTKFPFGFTERRFRVAIDRDVLVYPSIEPQPGFEELLAGLDGEVLTRLQGRGDDFHRIRPYEHNENVRHLDWKMTAHTGELQVREYVRHEQPTVEIVFDLGVPPGAEEWFENAVHCCAYLAWSLDERSAAFRFRTQQCDLTCPDTADVYAILRFLALVEPSASAAPLDVEENEAISVVLSLRDARSVRIFRNGTGA